MAEHRALIVGATGIVGSNLAQHLQQLGGWTVYGLARRAALPAGIHPLAADLQDADAVRAAIAGTRPTHVFPHGCAKPLRQRTSV